MLDRDPPAKDVQRDHCFRFSLFQLLCVMTVAGTALGMLVPLLVQAWTKGELFFVPVHLLPFEIIAGMLVFSPACLVYLLEASTIGSPKLPARLFLAVWTISILAWLPMPTRQSAVFLTVLILVSLERRKLFLNER